MTQSGMSTVALPLLVMPVFVGVGFQRFDARVAAGRNARRGRTSPVIVGAELRNIELNGSRCWIADRHT